MERACWAASTSVGASSAHWYPASTICSIASTDTMVLPEPTSPCSIRFIGRLDASSRGQHLEHFRLARGQFERQLLAHRAPPGRPSTGGCGRTGFAQLAVAPPTSAHCRPMASSKVSRSLARSRSTAFSARWMARSASSSEIRSPLLQKDFGQRLGDRVEDVEHLTHARVDVPALHLAWWPDRSGRSPVSKHGQHLVPGCSGRGGDRRQRLGADCFPLGRLETRGTPDASAASCRLKYPTSPESISRVPSTRPFFRNFALKKVAVTLGRRSRSVTTQVLALPAVTGFVPLRPRPSVMTSTKVTCSPSSSSRSSPSSPHRHAVAVLARVVPQQIVDGADAEVLLQRVRRPSCR